MTITTRDQLIDALANNVSRVVVDKASLANQTAGRLCSLWRATGFPAQGAIPTTPAVPTNATLGSVGFANQTAPATSYIGQLALASSNNTTSIEVYDRIAHNGGLVLNVTTAQTITGLDLSTLGIPADRIGEADYSDVQWFLEVYADGGATASNATINVTYDNGTTGNLTTLAVGGTIRAGNMFPLRALIPAGSQARNIRGPNSVTLSASTGTAGNFGFTAVRLRTTLTLPNANQAAQHDWAMLGLPSVPNDACLMFAVLSGANISGTLRGGGKISHG
jgi:hypothetical protein